MRLTRERLLLFVLLAAVVAVWWLAWGELRGELRITVLDVEQGDSILVQAPGGRTMLIDGGGRPGSDASEYDIGREVVVPVLLARGVRKLDVLVITHPHEDHIGGLPAVLEAVPVALVLSPMISTDTDAERALAGSVKAHDLPVERIAEGARITLGRGIYAEALNPPDPPLPGTGSDENENSVVLRLVYGKMSMLLAADIEEVATTRLAQSGHQLRSIILKVSHHGSAGAAVPAFLDAVSPELAVISVGEENAFGHPSEEMLGELRRIGAKVMRTDRDGAVTITLTPTSWSAAGSSRRGRATRFAGQISPEGATARP